MIPSALSTGARPDAMPPITAPSANGVRMDVEKIEANASGYAVQQMASTKTSQTWFASRTGPIARLACSRRARHSRKVLGHASLS